jgi:LmbE family N-acetylglucosaminyl deacetylase
MKILLLAPHADDIELGCGATVARFAEENHDILWIVIAPVELLNSEHLLAVEEVELKKSKCPYFQFDIRCIFERRKELRESFFSLKSSFIPDLVIGPSLNDLHQDHQTVAEEMVRAFKNSCSVICYELPWNHISFNAQLLVRLEKRHVDKKLQMLKKFKSQIPIRGKYFSEKLVRGLSAVRGIQLGSEYAEAFEVVRWVL